MFTCFPRLPQEIQNMIWTRALPPARNIQVMAGTSTPDNRGPHDRATENYSTGVVPVVLHVCSKSRALAMINYKLASCAPYSNRVLWLSFDKDTLVISGLANEDLHLTGIDPYNEMEDVLMVVEYLKYLAVPADLTYHHPASHIQHFTNLKEIVFYESNHLNGRTRPHGSLQPIQGPLITADTLLTSSDWEELMSSVILDVNTLFQNLIRYDEKLLLKQMQKNAEMHNIDNFEDPTISYIPQAMFDKKYEVPKITDDDLLLSSL